MNKYLYEEEHQSDPMLRTTFCPVETTVMPQEYARPLFFKAVASAKSKKGVSKAFEKFAISMGCLSNIGNHPDAVENLKRLGYMDEKGRLSEDMVG